jgi:hypothetical protein
MENKTLITYSLLSHLKETRNSEFSNIVELFFPIVKKAIVEYSNEHGNFNVKGRNISEIQLKVIDFFGIEIPLGVLDFILSQINKEIANEKVFAYYKDKSFIINAFIFIGIDDEIRNETQNIEILRLDFENFCVSHDYEFNFNELIRFICAQKIELFATKNKEDFDFQFHIPKYISLRFNDERLYKIISDIYLGGLISSYFEYKINAPVANTELIIDTNFFISLIDLNTSEAYSSCQQLYKICDRLGYKFSILFSTVEQIKFLLSSRIHDFASKEIGLIKEADIFGACIRRSLDKSQLERIKDSLPSLFSKYKIDVLHEAQIKDIVEKSKKSDKFKELLELVKGQRQSALNDTIAYYYVKQKRGENVQEFVDVKCWFLNNTFHDDYFKGLGYRLHERYKISANELLTLLWLANPSQEKIDFQVLSKGGLSTYIAKYKQQKIPSINTIKDINYRAKKAIGQGELSEKDVFTISVRMSEGQLSNGEAKELAILPDEDFIKSVKALSKKDEEILIRIDKQTEIIKKQNILLEEMKQQNIDNQYNIEKEKYERDREKYVESRLPAKIIKMNTVALGYLIFVIIIATLWILNYLEFKVLGVKLSGLISFILFLATLFIRFIEHNSVLKCLKFLFIRSYRVISLDEFRKFYENEFTNQNKGPNRKLFA